MTGTPEVFHSERRAFAASAADCAVSAKPMPPCQDERGREHAHRGATKRKQPLTDSRTAVRTKNVVTQDGAKWAYAPPQTASKIGLDPDMRPTSICVVVSGNLPRTP